MNYLHICLSVHMNALVSTECYLAVLLLQVNSLPFPFVFVQVFGDYYHFRHHAVEKRALSGHRGMHVRLEKEPQVKTGVSSHAAHCSTAYCQQKAKRQTGLHADCV